MLSKAARSVVVCCKVPGRRASGFPRTRRPRTGRWMPSRRRRRPPRTPGCRPAPASSGASPPRTGLRRPAGMRSRLVLMFINTNTYFDWCWDAGVSLIRRTGLGAEAESISDRPHASRSARIGRACPKIYVAVFSGDSGQDDPARGARALQRRDRRLALDAAGSRQPVAQTVLRATRGRPGGALAPGSAPGFSPQRWSCKSKPSPVNCRPPGACPCRG